MIIKIIRVFLLLISTYGYSQYLFSKSKLRAEPVLPVIFAGFGSAVFIAGLLNVMAEAAALIFLFGIVLCIISVKRKYNPAGLVTAGTVICATTLGLPVFQFAFITEKILIKGFLRLSR